MIVLNMNSVKFLLFIYIRIFSYSIYFLLYATIDKIYSTRRKAQLFQFFQGRGTGTPMHYTRFGGKGSIRLEGWLLLSLHRFSTITW